MSSRNAYLAAADRARAVVLSQALRAAHDEWRSGETAADRLEARMRDTLGQEPEVTVEYIAVVDPETLAPVKTVNGRTIVALAARIGSTRLIDNIVLAQGIG